MADYDAWANETPEPTPTPSDAEVLRKFLDTSAPDYDVVGHGLTYGHLRGVLRERDQLTNALRVEKLRSASAEKLFAAAETEARSLRAQRDSMEGALNKANQELHTITRCGDIFQATPFTTTAPCARREGHDGAHANRDGAQWAPHPATGPCEHAGTVFDALERLHLRLHGMLPCDGSELPQPEDPFWARQLDELLTFADELYLPLADAPRGQDAYQAGYDRAVTQIAELFGLPINPETMHHHNQPRPEHGYAPDAADRIAALPDASITLTGAPAIRHFSPGYDGEKPDHHGPETTCAMPACVKRRAQHEAAAEIQDLTRDMLRDQARAFPRADWLIWSHEHAAWWKPFEQGYTPNLAEAGRYLHPRAYQICREANGYNHDWTDGLPPEVMIEYTDDPETAATAVREATAQWRADRADRETTGE